MGRTREFLSRLPCSRANTRFRAKALSSVAPPHQANLRAPHPNPQPPSAEPPQARMRLSGEGCGPTTSSSIAPHAPVDEL